MNNDLSVDSTLLSVLHPQLARHMSKNSIFISSLVGLLGIIFILLPIFGENFSSTINMLLLTLGTIFLLVALYRFFWKSTEIVYIPSGSKISEGSCFFDSCDFEDLADAMICRNFSLSKKVALKQNGNIRLDYLVSKDRQFAAVQLFRFVPYAYEPATEVYYYMGNDAVLFARYLNIKKN